MLVELLALPQTDQAFVCFALRQPVKFVTGSQRQQPRVGIFDQVCESDYPSTQATLRGGHLFIGVGIGRSGLGIEYCGRVGGRLGLLLVDDTKLKCY